MPAAKPVDLLWAAIRAALWRGIWLTVLLALLGGVVGGVYGWSRERLQEANATILLNPLNGNPFSTTGRGDNLENLETEAQLVRSYEVGNQVRAETGVATSVEDLLRGLDIEVPTNTQLLVIGYTSTNGQDALKIAQAFADEFLRFRESRARVLLADQINSAETLIKDRQAEQAKLLNELSNATGEPVKESSLTAQIDAITTQVNQLSARVAELGINSFTPGLVVTPAALHRGGLLVSWGMYAGVGGLAGVVLSVVVAVVRSRRERRVHHPDDVVLAGRVLLGVVDLADALSIAEGMGVAGVSADVPPSFKDLRVAILSQELMRPVVILVAATGSDESGRVPIAAPALALSMGEGGLRTVVVDTVGDWPCPLDSSPAVSLGDILRSGGDPSGQTRSIGENLSLISADTDDRGDDLYMSTAMRRMVDQLRDDAEIIVLVTDNVHAAHSRALVMSSDAVITEVQQDVSRYPDVSLGSVELEEKDLGVVFLAGSRQPLGNPHPRRQADKRQSRWRQALARIVRLPNR